MEFVLESISPTKKKLTISLTSDEVNKALDSVIAQYKKDLSLPGFRKGKVPNSVVFKKFSEEITNKATEETLKVYIKEVFQKEHIKPLGNLLTEDTDFIRNESFSSTLTFEILPEITFPNYEGLEVHQDVIKVTDEEVEELLKNIQLAMAELVDVKEDRLPQDGDVIDVDYKGFENGSPVTDVSGEHFVLTLGQRQALEDFEQLVKTAKVGEKKVGVVTFPKDYAHKALAGKSIDFHIKLNSIKTPILPELDTDFAKKAGYEDLDKLREAAKIQLDIKKKQNAKSNAMKKLINSLLEQVTFDIPETMLETRIERILGDHNIRSQQTMQAQTGEESSESEEELYNNAKVEALAVLRPQIFLMALAEKEKLVVMEQEVERALYNMAIRARQDYNKFRDAYYRSGLVYELQDHLLAEKAMELIYNKASVVEIEQ